MEPPGPGALSIYTNRIVKSTGKCKTPHFREFTRGNLETIYPHDGTKGVNFPSQAAGAEAIYYLTTPILSQNDSNVQCGPGCSDIKVLEPAAGPLFPGPLSQVSNPSNMTATSLLRQGHKIFCRLMQL